MSSNINDLYPSNYVRASDLEGKPHRVYLRRVVVAEMGKSRDKVPVVFFSHYREGIPWDKLPEAPKAFVLNATNRDNITARYGTAYEEAWPGALLELSPREVQFAGKTTTGLLVMPVDPPTQPPPAPPSEPERLAAEMNAEPSEMPGAHLELEGEGRFF